jgi:hypothetical protein
MVVTDRSEYDKDWGRGRWGGIAIAVIVIRNDNAPVVDIIVVNPRTRVAEIAASADGQSRRLRESPLLCDDCAENDAPEGYGR